ncbi:MAG: hypothetical protein HZA90_10880 [Verrucomicrobia bacterium]|nr:hypothetical protein [Verrucomicrobiota bacterium]
MNSLEPQPSGWRRRAWHFAALGLLVAAVSVRAATLETLLTNGPTANRVNLVFLSEGYRTNELPQFLADAASALNNFLSADPYAEYASYFNAFAIAVASAQSGSDRPSIGKNVDTYFSSAHDAVMEYLITIPAGSTGQGRVTNLLQTFMPHSDLAVVLVNDPMIPGGSGGQTVVTTPVDFNPYILVHESAHTLAGLGDEYTNAFTYPDLEEPNTTRQTNRNLIKWRAWIDTNTPLPTPPLPENYDTVGLFEGAHYHPKGWYRPQMDCTMNSYAAPFCRVCREALTLSIYQRIRPVESFLPTNTALTLTTTQAQTYSLTLLQPVNHSLSVQWLTNGVAVPGATETSFTLSPATLPNGTNLVQARVTDDTDFVRTDPTNLLRQTLTWTTKVELPEVRLSSPVWLGNDRFTFRVTGSAPQGFSILASTNLTGGPWLALTTNFLANGQANYTNTTATNRWRFFRARTLP